MEDRAQLILIVEDDPDLAEILDVNLQQNGFATAVTGDGKKACEMAVSLQPSLILLDLMLPKLPGLEVLQFIKRRNDCAWIPTIIISAKDDEDTIVKALEEGAEDYITKPCSTRETLARISAVLRRTASVEENADQTRALDDLVVDFSKHRATIKNKEIKLTKTEFDILWSFMKDNNQVFTRKHLLQLIHGPGIHTLDRNIDVHVVSLRKKLGEYGKRI
ncbi:MAG: response regulator transcription factor, partial [Bdellovibrionales bacterium]|nr:response regulator transcription factor [Bdellovibrionales bacterium]